MKKTYLNLGLLIMTLVFVAATAGATPAIVPEASSTSLLLGVVVMGLATIKRFIKR